MKFIIMSLLLLFSVAGYSADAENRFMAKGAGLASCDRFLNAAELKNKEYYNYGGWVEGFITAFNQLRPDTFDVAPWQSADYLIAIVTGYCIKNENASFYQATAYVVKALDSQRLKNFTPLLTIRVGNESMLIHQEILVKTQKFLLDSGFYEKNVSGVFNKETEVALKKYQKEKLLKQTGLPDHATLINLFYLKN
ncbi:peptidoglycan-binding domain-containing protein [Neptunomonas qingdaonensis]|uniref:Putative peptidoglycan binding domain-containing protein n=1 Tax=Neptunomonas qingdaonensis TaxID=1045558 RepID=A0A1I2PCV7_9GAMM|nr:peptidoglycan-binding domain-containing protein [Neptunomonas qingdaonensis]SFG11281.1 Putative peptidoglycan binding domain-containing protein [Neptunomonas qingdaonensis]